MDYLIFCLALLVPVFLISTVPIRILARKYSAKFPQTVVSFSLSSMFGTIMFFFSMSGVAEITRVPAEILPAIYIPIYVFSTIYNADHYIFMRCLPQVIIICIFLYIGMTGLLAVVIKDILHHNLSYSNGLIAAVVSVPIQPSSIISMLKDLAKYKYLGTILEIESLLMLIPAMTTLQTSCGYFDKFQTKWYQFICTIIRYYLVSAILGYVIGKITSKLMGWYYNIPKNVITISISMSFLTYFLAEYILFTSGTLALIIVSCQVKFVKHRFTTEVESCMSRFWAILSYIAEKIFSVLITVITTYYFWLFFDFKDIFRSIIFFFSANIFRFLMFMVLYPIMNVLRYNINVRSILVLGWCGVKSSLNLMMIFMLLSTRCTTVFTQSFLMEVMVYSYLTMILNSSSINMVVSTLGMAELSNTRKINMNNCLQYIMQKRTYNINIFKLNRYLSDVNWRLVRRKTVLKHPYTVKHSEEQANGKIEEDGGESDEEIDAERETGTLVCPDCIKEVPYDVSEKEIKEMIQEAQIKILKAKMVSIIKQYENGVINKNCLQLLVYTFELMIESNSQTNTINLKSYLKKNKCLELIYTIISLLNSKSFIYEPPENLWRRLCHYIVMHKAYNYVIFIFNLIYAFIILYFGTEPGNHPNVAKYIIATTIILHLEMIVRVLAISERNISQGLTRFFKSRFNILEFLLLLLQNFDVMLLLLELQSVVPLTIQLYFALIIGVIRLTRIVDFLKPVYSKWLKMLDYKMDSKVCFGYDLAAALVNCCDEVLLMLGHIIEVNIIKSLYMKELQLEKAELVKIMEEVQSERPYIAITVKTKQAIRTTLSAMEDSLNDLKVSGYLDNMEYVYVLKEIFDRQNYLRDLKFVQISSPKLLFFEVPWMLDDKVREYLFLHAEKVFWNKGEVVCQTERIPPGVYIFVGGLLRLTYTPKPLAKERIKTMGTIPIIDYYATLKFDEAWEDRITSGNSVGELSLLTGRPYDCTIVADSSSQAYFLSTELIHRAMKLSKDPINGLEARMWKWSTINLAVAILTNVPLYQMMTQEQIKYKLQRAFMPNISCYKMFVITGMMDDVILMEGMAADYNYGYMFVAPMHIPRTTQKLILPRSSYLNVDDKIVVKLLVIPVGNAKEIEIMIEEEELAEFVAAPSSSCLLNLKEEYTRRESFKTPKKFNVEPILTKSSYFSLSMFAEQSHSKFEVLESAPNTIGSASISTGISEAEKLQLLTQNKTLVELEGSQQNLN